MAQNDTGHDTDDTGRDETDADDTGRDETDDTGRDDQDDTGGDGDDWTPPSREEWEATQAALRKANSQAKRHRLARKGKTDDNADDADSNDDAERRAEEKWKPRLVSTAAKAAFATAGAKRNTSRLARMLDLEDIEVDEDGEVHGLEEQIEELKADFPELFTTEDAEPARRRRRTPDADARSRRSATPKQTSSQKLAAQIRGT